MPPTIYEGAGMWARRSVYLMIFSFVYCDVFYDKWGEEVVSAMSWEKYLGTIALGIVVAGTVGFTAKTLLNSWDRGIDRLGSRKELSDEDTLTVNEFEDNR